MNIKLIRKHTLLTGILGLFILTACEEAKEDPIPVTPPPPGTTEYSPNVGGPQQPNHAFIDLNTKSQFSSARNSWDIALSNGPEFRVTLNFSNGVLVRRLNQSLLDSVKRVDWTAFSSQLDISALLNAGIQNPTPPWLNGSPAWIDNPNGRLDSTAIPEISPANANNFVFLMNRGSNPDGSSRGMVLIKINKESNGYIVQVADTAETVSGIRTYTYTKQGSSGFGYMNLSNGNTSSVFPATWHLCFTFFTTLSGPQGPGSLPVIPYRFSDYVILNTAETQGYQQDTSVIKYADFDYSDIENNRLVNNRLLIGSGWRSISQFGSTPPSIRANRYWIIRSNDASSSAGARYFKLRFISLLNTQGERGYPKFELIELKP
jgi:hypothetical protein